MVIVEIDHVPHMHNGEELLYVALSRARNELFVVGGKGLMETIEG